MKVLVIDDSIFIHKMIEKALVSNGHEIVGFADYGATGVKLYEQLKPEVVILDINMPGMNGVSCAKRIFSIDPAARIIVLSSIGAGELITEAKEAGIYHFLTKPLNIEVLIDTMNAIKG